ncbi:MAG: glycosyltransferase [Lactobacillales bacterium]|jgi:raffinose-raffinose alpha-galactotransferase|nr:glycosyltransferase [Lactobacillales bacterium]
MKNQKVSVVVTCYNHEKYIEQCLRSVFAQTHKNIELFIFNDGSPDRSGEIIESILVGSPFEKTKYFCYDNMGIVKTRNKALSMLSGDFILFVDSDNFLDDSYVEKLLQCANDTDSDIVYCDLYDPDKREIFLRVKEYSLEGMLKGNFIDNCSLIRRSIVNDIKYDRYFEKKKLLEDYDFFLQLIVKNGAKPRKCHSTKLNYRVLKNSRTRERSWSYYYGVYSYIAIKYSKFYPKIVEKVLELNFCDLIKQIQERDRQIQERDGQIQERDGQIQERDKQIQEQDKQIQEQDKRYVEAITSKSWKIGRLITFPVRKIKEIKYKITNQK